MNDGKLALVYYNYRYYNPADGRWITVSYTHLMKKVTVNGTVVSHERYLYRGYLQLAALDMLDNRNVLRTLLWDPLEPVATRPLALVQENALYCYGRCV